MAFRGDRTPVQLVMAPNDRFTVQLWDLAGGRLLHTFQLVPGGKAQLPQRWDHPELALSPDARYAVASVQRTETAGKTRTGKTMIWDTASGAVPWKLERPISAAAFTPDGAYLATGERNWFGGAAAAAAANTARCRRNSTI